MVIEADKMTQTTVQRLQKPQKVGQLLIDDANANAICFVNIAKCTTKFLALSDCLKIAQMCLFYF